MITRIVKLTFREDAVDDFEVIWKESKDKIIQSEGCHYVEMLEAKVPSNIRFTYSIWESEEHLNKYRHSELFKKTWSKTKVLFDGKPEAWTTYKHSFVEK